MKLIVVSIVLVGTVSAKTGSGSIISKKKNLATSGLRGQEDKQHHRKNQLDDGEDLEEALSELFGDTPQVEDLSQDPAADSDNTSQGFDINELVEDLLDSNGDAVIGDGFLEDLLGDGAANGGDSTTSGGGLLDFLGMDMYACSDKCKEEDKGVCDSFMMAIMNPTSVFEDACNTGCIPQVRLDICTQFCSDDATTDDIDTAVTTIAQNRGMFDSLVQDLMCSDCKFYTCCASDDGSYDTCKDELATDVDDQATGDSILSDLFADLSGSLSGSFMENVDIDSVMEGLPDLSSIFPSEGDSSSGLADTPTDWNFQDLLDQMLAALGMEDLFSGLQDIFDEESMTADFETIADTITCDPTCPIDGLCTGDLDFSSFKPDDLCTQNALFACGDGLDTLCSECTSGDREGGMICNLCSIATCCKDGDSSFQECALSSPLAQGFLQDDADAVDVSVPEDDSESAEAATPQDQAEAESPEQTSETPQVISSVESASASQVISSVESASASSYVSTTMYVALAAVATLFLSL